MSSAKPVPSRAALNALRGILFTTSCSVILLAEERRRRLNIARAAIDNARKLHTVRSNRGPLALGEGWEGRTCDDDALLTQAATKQSRNPHRRRRPDDLTNYILHDPDFEIHKHFTNPPSVELDVPVAASTAISADSMRSMQPPPPTSCHGVSPKPLRPPPLQFFSTSYLLPHLTSEIVSQADNLDDAGRVSETSEASQPTRVTTLMPSPERGTPRSHYKKEIVALRRMLKAAAKRDAEASTISQNIKGAITTLGKLVCVEPSTADVARLLNYERVRALKRVAELDATKVPDVLKVLLSNGEDRLRVLYPYTRWLQEKDNKEELERLLVYLAEDEQSQHWRDGRLIHRLLFHQNQFEATYEQMQAFYRIFIKAGLFDKIKVAQGTEYKIRRLMFLRASEAEDHGSARAEAELMEKLQPEAFRADARVQGILIAREASLGHWSRVRRGLDALSKVADTRGFYFQEVLRKVADVFAQSHSADKLEGLLRGFVGHYSIPLKRRWVHLVLDGHASRLDFDAMFAWIRLCSENGVMDEQLIQSFCATCRKHLSFSEASISAIHKSLQQMMPTSKTAAPAAEVPTSEDVEQNHALASEMDSSAECLRLAVTGYVQRGDEEGISQALSSIRAARSRGHDVSAAATAVLLARLDRGEDGDALIRAALRDGLRIGDSVYNRAARTTLARGDADAAIRMCELAAREKGQRELPYSEYNFANLVYAYTGTWRYEELKRMLAGFTAARHAWKGSAVCKESIKLAMKAAAKRAVVHAEEKGRHEEMLVRLDEALTHVKRCRLRGRDKVLVREAFVSVVAQPVVTEALLDSEGS